MKSSQRKSAVSTGTASVDISSSIRNRWSTTGYSEIAERILPRGYALSVVLIGDNRARALNVAHRKKSTPANILSFPLTERSGEIFLNIARIKREANRFGLTPGGHAKFLLIHGCLHLKGYAHGSTMEEAENALVRKLNIR